MGNNYYKCGNLDLWNSWFNLLKKSSYSNCKIEILKSICLRNVSEFGIYKIIIFTGKLKLRRVKGKADKIHNKTKQKKCKEMFP